MLDLDSNRWSELQHAYGGASDVPALLRQLESLPDSVGNKEPWFSLWSALAHQGDVYSASFAAVPHVVAAIERAPSKASGVYFHFPAWVEICRRKKGVSIPADLQVAYSSALAKLPPLAGLASASDWDTEFLVSVLATIAACKGYTSVAEAALELTPDTADEFLEWFHDC